MTENELPTIAGIQPGKLYLTNQVAEILEMHPKSVYAIPPSLLRRTRVGPKRGRVKILGADLIDYLRNQKAA